MAKKRASTSARKSKKAPRKAEKKVAKKAGKKTAKKKSGRKASRKAKRKATRPARPASRKRGRKSRTAMVPLALAAPAISDLNKIDHIVVLMMENRSFDHMLGYLSLELGKAVDGLTAGMANTHNGTSYPVHRLSNTEFPPGEDPCHTGACVADQLSGGNAGFVSNFAAHYPHAADFGLVMGYYNDASVPVYDTLAKRFCICDKWFCSVPGSTWPNRLYSLAGRAAGSKDNKAVPLYNLPTFVRHLEDFGVSWNWYAFDVSTLRLVDPDFRIGMFDRFRWVKHPFLPSFLRDAAAGDLPSVSWIDPNFSDFGFSGNDDHPPSDIRNGQELALDIVHAVTSGPQWNKTLLVIVYDEHGGIFDHSPPPIAADDSPAFRSYGVRVPAILVSPWVAPGSVSSEIFDHTSLIKTILLRFCQNAAGAIPDMGQRVTAANHLGSVLTETAPTLPVDLSHLITLATSWKAAEFQKSFRATAEVRAQPREANELQSGLRKARKKLVAMGHPPGHP